MPDLDGGPLGPVHVPDDWGDPPNADAGFLAAVQGGGVTLTFLRDSITADVGDQPGKDAVAQVWLPLELLGELSRYLAAIAEDLR
jgi:hypothetical protein